MSIRCPHCGTPSNVYDSRTRFDNSVQRVRECEECKEVFISIEVLVPHRVPPGMATKDFLRDYLLTDIVTAIEGVMLDLSKIAGLKKPVNVLKIVSPVSKTPTLQENCHVKETRTKA